MNGKTIGRTAAALTLAALSMGGAGADAPVAPTPGQQMAWALHLLQQARYGEAIGAAQDLVTREPNAAASYEVRGTLALYVGSLARARSDFQVAATRAPLDAAAQYGAALCALFGRRWDAARADLGLARRAPGLTAAQAADLDTADDYLDFLQGHPGAAPAIPSDDAMRQELSAMTALRADPSTGTALLTQFLQTPSGVPQVREDDGVRALFDAQTPLEPSVVEPTLRQSYGAMMGAQIAYALRRHGRLAVISGTVRLQRPPRPAASALPAVVTFSIDGHTAAMLDSAPFAFTWDTTQVVNGRHLITVEAEDAVGHALDTKTLTVVVQNAHPLVVDDGREDFTDADIAASGPQLWDLLRLRPARKAAQWALADALALQGDRAGADAHRLVAAALDPDYKDSRRYAGLALDDTPLTALPHAFRVASTKALGLWRGDASLKQVALTFDDGPNPQKTPALLDALDQAGVPATFFVVGARAGENPDLIRRMARMGDDVENHSYTHPNMDQVDPIVAEEELLRNCVVVQALTGRAPRFFRPPGGNGGPAVGALARRYGLTETFWSLDAISAEYAGSPAALVRFVLARVHPGSIVLMHDAPDATIAAIPALAAGLRAQGYQLVTLSQMARSGRMAAAPALAGHE